MCFADTAAYVTRLSLPRVAPPQALFTGIVQGMAEITKIEKKKGTSAWSEFDDFQTMTIKFPPGKVDGVAIGASIAINGTCLTVREPPFPLCIGFLAYRL